MNRILSCKLSCRPEPLMHSFGFKGGSVSQLWQVACVLTDDDGRQGLGLGVQSVLWSDAAVFSSLGPDSGNECMLSLTRYALNLLQGRTLLRPDLMLQQLLGPVWEYGRKISGLADLRLTFVLNALTPVDWALWQLYARQRQCFHLTVLAPPRLCRGLEQRQPVLGNVPLISYSTGQEEILSLARQGTFLYKIKIGSAPGAPSDLDAMLVWDCNRLSEIHRLLERFETPYTDCGHPVYYLDANGRYDTTRRVEALLEYAEKAGMLDRIVLLEEPFAEENLQNVSALPVRVAGDESAHSAGDAVRLMDEYGYSAIALKPVAKTLSVTLDVLREAHSRQVPCFCADLTVNPAMVQYNKCIAGRLAILPGLKAGVMESNGAQNYTHWKSMEALNPSCGEPWTVPQNGFYSLNDRFYETDGGIWQDYPHYQCWPDILCNTASDRTEC